MIESNVIAVDFDGVIHNDFDGYRDGSLYGPPIEGAEHALSELMEQGYYILIYSVRAHARCIGGEMQKSQRDEIRDWLIHYQIPFNEVYQGPGKPWALLYIDDRAVRFEGNWSQTMLAVRWILESGEA